jgi:metallo-beta-lactamase class B
MKSTSRTFHLLALCSALVAAPALAADGAKDTMDSGDDHVHCDNCEDWNQPQAPFKIFGNTWYVGTSGLSSILVTSPDGHVLLDGALPQSAPIIQANIEALGFRMADVKLILNSHEHWDHAGGIAALQRASGAEVAASPAAARVLRQGTVGVDDPQFDAASPVNIPKVPEVTEVADLQTVKVGNLAIKAYATPGHTPGSTTWSWTSCQTDDCRKVVYADSLNPVSLGDFRFSGGNGHPDRSEQFASSIARVAALPCDIVLSVHPGMTGTFEKLTARTADRNTFLDAKACAAYAAAASEKLRARLAEERQPEAGAADR